MNERVAILDCGGQYTKVIDRRVREAGTYSDIFPIGVDIDKIKDYSAFILSGGPSSVWSEMALKYNPAIFDLNKPVLGICYGMQLINEHFGGKVLPKVKTEYGQTLIDVDVNCPLFDGLDSKQAVLMSHGDAVKELAEGFKCVGMTGDVVAAIYNEQKRIIGVQFHPEVDLSENGKDMIENFLRKVCLFKEVYALDDRIKTSIDAIQKKVKDSKVMVLVSGGVDSAVTAALLTKALPPENVYAIHIDHGMMRKDESDIICENLASLGLVNMKRVNASKEFFYSTVDAGDDEIVGPLSETCDPETKRKIIGSMFIKVTREAAEELGIDFDNTFLAQGTLRPDLIESGNPDVSGYAHKIKTHHNDVDIVRRARERGMIIETNWDWHKDEVRQVARMLGLDDSIAYRQPFPGPGLGVRIICADNGIDIPEESKKKLSDFVSSSGSKVKSCIAPINSVGVQGDNRSYRNLCVLSGAEDISNLFDLAREIPNNLPTINRVAYVVGKELGDDLIVKPLHINEESTNLLREVDAITTNSIMNKKISQCFAVLVPVSSTGTKYSVAIRAVVTSDFMTARPAIPGKDFDAEALNTIASKVYKEFGDKIEYVMYDLTGKPPATVEWE